VPLLLAATVIGSIGFVQVQKRRRVPMVDLALFRHRPFVVSIIGSGLNGLFIIGTNSMLPTAWQHAHGFTALQAAAVFTVWPVASLSASLFARRMSMSSPKLLAAGFGLSVFQLAFAWTFQTWSLPLVVATYVVTGVGAGLANAANARLAIESVPPQRAGMGSGAANTARYVGSSVGVALMATLVGGGLVPGMRTGVLVYAASLAVAAVILLQLHRKN
jgi:MFS family permease